MNTILSTIAGAIIVLLIAALVGPTFVDWNSFRDDIEAQASRLTGREVKIAGDIAFVMLPSPHITLDSISISNVPGTENSDFARIGQIDAEVALAPLLRGEIGVTSIKVIRPEIHLEVLSDENSNWQSLIENARLPAEGMFSLSSIRLDQAHIEGGTLTFSNHVTMQSWRLNELSGDVIADSLLGPARAELAFTTSGIPFSLRVSLGRYADEKAFPVTVHLENKDAATKFLFSGSTTKLAPDGRINGTASFELGAAQTATDQKLPMRIEAVMAAADRKAEFHDVVLAMDGTTLKGTAEADWTGRPKLVLKVKGQALTLDPAIGQLVALMDDGVIPFSSLASMPLPDWFDISAYIAVDGLLIRDVLVKDAALNAGLQNGVLTLQRLSGNLAGGTSFSLNGVLATGEEGRSFDGKFNAASRDLASLARLLPSRPSQTPTEEAANSSTQISTQASEPGRPFSIAADFRLTPQSLKFQHMEAAYAARSQPAQLKGSMSIVSRELTSERPLITLALESRNFDMDPIMALWPEGAGAPVDLLAEYDADITVAADKLLIRDEVIGGLEASCLLSQDRLHLKTFNATDFAGARLALTGELNGLAKGKLAALGGTLQGTLATADIAGLRKLAGFESGGLSGAADFTLQTETKRDGKDRADSFILKGLMDGSRIDMVLTRKNIPGEAMPHLELVANAANEEGSALLTQLGLETRESEQRDVKDYGPATLALQMSGILGKPYETNFKFIAAGLSVSAKGSLADPFASVHFNGHIDVTGSEVQHVLRILGASEKTALFAATQADGPGFVLSSEIVATPHLMNFQNLEAVAGNFHLKADLTYTDADQDKRAQLDGSLQANRLDLTPLFAGTRTDMLSERALDWSSLRDFDGTARLKADMLTLGTLQLENADIPLALAGGELTASPLKARFAGGDAVLTAKFISGESGEQYLAMTAAVEDADLSKAGRQIFGTEFSKGKATASLQLEGQGRSWLGLVSSMKGTGSVDTSDASFTALDLAAFGEGIGTMKTFAEFAPLEKNVLMQGTTPVENLDGKFIIENGVVSFAQDDLALEGGTAMLAASFDMPRLVSDAKLTIDLTQPSEAPEFSLAATGKPEGVTRRLDAAALSQFVSTRMLTQSAAEAGVTSIPKALKDLMGGLSGEASGDKPQAKGSAVAGIPQPVERPTLTRPSLQ